MTDNGITIHLTLEEGNLLLEALMECPFKIVFELIGKLNHQANTLFDSDAVRNARQPFCFAEAELTLIIKALGQMPYHRVHKLLSDLQQQIHATLSSA